MKKSIRFMLLALTSCCLQLKASDGIDSEQQRNKLNLAVFLDSEVDDIASVYAVINAYKQGLLGEIIVVVTGYKTETSAQLVRNHLILSGMCSIPVYAGTTLEKIAEQEVQAIASAVKFDQKANYVREMELHISPEHIETYQQSVTFSNAQDAIFDFFTRNTNIYLLCLTAVTDILPVLRDRDLSKHIHSIHMTGGFRVEREEDKTVNVSTFNHNMDINSSCEFFDLCQNPEVSFDIYLYSTHNMPGMVRALDHIRYPVFFAQFKREAETAVNMKVFQDHMIDWNEHTMINFPLLAHSIGPKKQSQMCQADVVATLSVLNDYITDFETAVVSIDSAVLSASKKGYYVTYTPSAEGKIRFPKTINNDVFAQKIMCIFE